MSYGLNALVHNTSWVTAHFHLIFGGAVVIMYFAIAYEIWPRLTGREPRSHRAQTTQLWFWFIGMMIMSLPWHWLGLEGQWRRVAQFDYTNGVIASWGPWVIVSFFGGIMMLGSALLFIYNLTKIHRSPVEVQAPYHFAVAAHAPQRIPSTLNSFGFWNVVVALLMLLAYGWPLAQFFTLAPPQAVVHRVDRGG